MNETPKFNLNGESSQSERRSKVNRIITLMVQWGDNLSEQELTTIKEIITKRSE